MKLLWNSQCDDVTLDEDAPDSVELTDDQLIYWLQLDHTHPQGPAAVAAQLSPAVMSEIATRGQAGSETLLISWSRAAARYAPFTANGPHWDLRYFDLAHRQPVQTWAMQEFVVTNTDMRFFVLLDGTPVTSAEFKYLYDQTAIEHLDDHRELVNQLLTSAATSFLAPLQAVRATLALADGTIATRDLQILEGSQAQFWAGIATGEKLLDFEPLPFATAPA